MEDFIDNCPACGTLLVESYSGKSVSCPNPKCIGRGIARMADMLSKINFRDFSEATVKDLSITSFTDLLNITPDKLAILGDVNSKKFMERVNELKTKQVYDYNIIGALGFTDIAIKSWKIILHALKIEEVLNLPDSELQSKLMKLKGIGKVAVETILNEREVFVVRTYNLVDNRKKIVITGFRDDTLAEKMAPLGYFVTDTSVTRDTNILVVPHVGFSSSKVDKALKYGIQIEALPDFRKRFGL